MDTGPPYRLFTGYHYDSSAHPARGASASMKVQDIDLCGNATTYPVFSAIWTMVSGTFYNSGYAQIGWNKFSVNGSILFYNFWEWTECIGGCADHAALTASSPDVGSYHEYKVSYKSDKSLHMYIDVISTLRQRHPAFLAGLTRSPSGKFRAGRLRRTGSTKPTTRETTLPGPQLRFR